MSVRTMAMALAVLSGGLCAAGPVLTGETSHPASSWYRLGEKVEVTLVAEGLSAGETRRMKLVVTDDEGREIRSIPDQIVADGAGKWTGTYAVPAERLGYYAVRPVVEGGLALPKVGSRPAGILCYSVTPDFRTKRAPPEEDLFFSTMGGYQDMAEYLGMHLAHGWGSCWEDESRWAEVKDKIVARRKAWPVYGFVTKALEPRRTYLLSSEAKACVAAHAGTGANPWLLLESEEGLRHLRDTLGRLGATVRARPEYGNRRHIYEIFWEPDLSKPSDEALVRVAQHAYEALHAADPEALVAVPTYSCTRSLALHRRLFELGLARYMDVFALHPYCFPPEINGLKESCRAYREMIRRFKGRDIPMIGTEAGCSVRNTPADERLRRDGFVRQQLILLGEGLTFNATFYGHDFGSDDGKEMNGDYGMNYNLLLPKHRWAPARSAPKPVFPAMAAAVWFLDGKRPTAALDDLAETAQGYAYADRAGNCVLALWDWGGNRPTVTLPVGCDAIGVADVMGNVRQVACPNGNLALTLGASPQYVIAPSAKLWGAGGTAARRLADEAAARRAAAAERRPLSVVRVLPQVSSDGRMGVSVRIGNRAGRTLGAKVATRLRGEPGARRERAVTLAPKSETAANVFFDRFSPDPFAVREVEVAVTPDAGEPDTAKVRLNFFDARHVPADASLENWPVLKGASVPPRAVRGSACYRGEADCSARLAAGWNGKGLFLEVVVSDDAFVQEKTGWWTWQGDALQFGFAKDARLKPSANGLADQMETAYSEITFAQTKNGAEAYRTITFDPVRFPADAKGAGQIAQGDCPLATSVTKKEKGVEIRYRAIVPWAFFNKTSAAANENVWFALNVNDMDADGLAAIGAFELKTSAPAAFGSITLAP